MIESDRYLLDTNVVSATRRSEPHAPVGRFLAPIAQSRLSISVLTLGELRRGLEMKRARHLNGVASLARWVEEIALTYSGRTLEVDIEVANLWGRISADRTRPIIGTLIAATAVVHGMTLVTRNTDDFEGLNLKLLNPWLL